MSEPSLVHRSIYNSVMSLEGVNPYEKSIIYNHIISNLEDDRSEYEAGMNIADKSGPALWEHLHWMAKMADETKNIDIYGAALDLLTVAHPCPTCRSHIPENLDAVPLSNYSSAFVHSVDFHNLVNAQLGKPAYPKEEAAKYYGADCESCVFGAPTNARSMHQS